MPLASAGLHIAKHINLDEITMSWKDFKKSKNIPLVSPVQEELVDDLIKSL